MKVIDLGPKEIIDHSVQLINPFNYWRKTKGKGIKVAVLDTAVYPHNEFKDRICGGINLTSANHNDWLDKTGTQGDHCTFCSGLIAAQADGRGIIGVAPECELYIVRVLNNKSLGTLEWLKNGINWCIRNDIDIINLSLGFSKDYPQLHDAVVNAYNAGIICVAAAGNNRYSPVEYPAAYKEVLAISAVQYDKQIAKFASAGQQIMVVAQGVNVISTLPKNLYGQASGTSFSTPLIAGSIALIQSHAKQTMGRKLTNQEITQFIIEHCEDLGPKGFDNSYGYGMFMFG